MADKERVYCDHCDTWVSKRTQRLHRSLVKHLVYSGKFLLISPAFSDFCSSVSSIRLIPYGYCLFSELQSESESELEFDETEFLPFSKREYSLERVLYNHQSIKLNY